MNIKQKEKPLRNRLRIFYVWLKKEVESALTPCSVCGQRGIESVSIRFPQVMCGECDAMYRAALARCGYDKELVEVYLKEYGIKEFKRTHGGYNYNPLADADNEGIELTPAAESVAEGLLVWTKRYEEEEANVVCTVPPEGWYCSRHKGHEGPCAARPTGGTPVGPAGEEVPCFDTYPAPPPAISPRR